MRTEFVVCARSVPAPLMEPLVGKSFRSFNLYSASAVLALAAFASPARPAETSAGPAAATAPVSTPEPVGTAPVPADAPSQSDVAATGTDVAPFAETDDASASDAEIACIAKVVHHEAANQSREGQLAVAQVIRNRTQASGFARSVCGVVAQQGQFFDVAAYRPADDGRWRTALSVAREAMKDDTAQIVPGALFYRAKFGRSPSFMRSRQQLAVLGDHIFYR